MLRTSLIYIYIYKHTHTLYIYIYIYKLILSFHYNSMFYNPTLLIKFIGFHMQNHICKHLFF
jgi:hypothetical protein